MSKKSIIAKFKLEQLAKSKGSRLFKSGEELKLYSNPYKVVNSVGHMTILEDSKGIKIAMPTRSLNYIINETSMNKGGVGSGQLGHQTFHPNNAMKRKNGRVEVRPNVWMHEESGRAFHSHKEDAKEIEPHHLIKQNVLDKFKGIKERITSNFSPEEVKGVMDKARVALQHKADHDNLKAYHKNLGNAVTDDHKARQQTKNDEAVRAAKDLTTHFNSILKNK